MKKQKVVIFDIDGVLADFEGAFCEAFGNKNRHLYALSARYPEVDPDLIKEWVNDEENYRHLNPIFGGITLLNQLKSKGYRVILLTSRPVELEKSTLEWLRKYSIPFDFPLAIGIKNKANFINENLLGRYVVDLFIDDHKETLEKVKEVSPTTVCLAWAQPWNDGYFPRAIYDNETMKIMVNIGDGNWKWIWSKK